MFTEIFAVVEIHITIISMPIAGIFVTDWTVSWSAGQFSNSEVNIYFFQAT